MTQKNLSSLPHKSKHNSNQSRQKPIQSKNITDHQNHHIVQLQLGGRPVPEAGETKNGDTSFFNIFKNSISMILGEEERKYQREENNKKMEPASGKQQSGQDIFLNLKRQIGGIISEAEKAEYHPKKQQNRGSKPVIGTLPSVHTEPPKKKSQPALIRIKLKEKSFGKNSIRIMRDEIGIINVRRRESKDVKIQQMLGNSSVVRKYELNMNKFEKIEDDREEIFKTRPKISSTPDLITPKQEKKKKQAKKIKTEPNSITNSPIGPKQQWQMPSQIELPIIKKSKVQYTKAPPSTDILSNLSQSLLINQPNQKTSHEYTPITLTPLKQPRQFSPHIKLLRKRRLNFQREKTQA